jgi:antitoxin MazE
LALRVPKTFAQEVGAAEGKRAEMTVDRGALVVRVVSSKKRRRYSLEKLVNGITEENHRAEVDWGPRRGNEV